MQALGCEPEGETERTVEQPANERNCSACESRILVPAYTAISIDGVVRVFKRCRGEQFELRGRREPTPCRTRKFRPLVRAVFPAHCFQMPVLRN
jgi:hypothetical protein